MFCFKLDFMLHRNAGGAFVVSVCTKSVFKQNIGDGDFLEKGYVHIYFGEGLGRLPIACGIALRAKGAGLSVGHFSDFPKNNLNLNNLREITKNFDMIILDGCDEICENALMDLITNRPKNTELILTAKNFGAAIIEAADLVSSVVVTDRG
jgi:ATP:corrinoid adenosyltransferase